MLDGFITWSLRLFQDGSPQIPHCQILDVWSIDPSQKPILVLGIGLKFLLCALVFYRRLFRRLPFFSLYVCVLVVEVTVVWWVYREMGLQVLPGLVHILVCIRDCPARPRSRGCGTVLD